MFSVASKAGSSSSSTTMPPPSTSTVQTSTFTFNGLPKLGPGHHRYPIATYPGVIGSENGFSVGHNKTHLPPAIRLNPNTNTSSRMAPSSGSASAASYSPNTSFIYKKADMPYPSSNQHNKSGSVAISDMMSGHRGYYNSYNNPIANNGPLSTHRPSAQGSPQQISSSRLPHAPYHPYHPSQLTSTPTPHWWRPHFTKQRHNYDASRPADQGYAYKKTFKGMMILFRFNSLSLSLDGQ